MEGASVRGDLVRLLRDALGAVEAELLVTLHEAGYPQVRRAHLTVFRALDPTGMRLADLARDASMTRQAVAQLVTDLKRLGVLEVVPDPADRRAKLVRYTPEGLRGYDVSMAAFARIERRHERRAGAAALATTREVLVQLSRGKRR